MKVFIQEQRVVYHVLHILTIIDKIELNIFCYLHRTTQWIDFIDALFLFYEYLKQNLNAQLHMIFLPCFKNNTKYVSNSSIINEQTIDVFFLFLSYCNYNTVCVELIFDGM